MFDVFGSVPFLLPGLVVLLLVGGFLWSRHRQQQLERTYRRVCRDQRLTPTDAPLGLSDTWLSQFELLPRGDRDCSAVWGMQAPAEVQLDGQAVPVPCAAFEWWWEDRSRDKDGPDTHHRRQVLVAAVRLPAPWVMPRTRVEREGVFARFGVGGRGDFQVESEEFNKRYDVRVRDREAAIRLFTPGFQEQMLTRFDGVAFELAGDVALVAVGASSGLTLGLGLGGRRGGMGGLASLFGRSGDRIGTDVQVIRDLAVLRHQALALLQAMPATWWRAVDGGGP